MIRTKKLFAPSVLTRKVTKLGAIADQEKCYARFYSTTHKCEMGGSGFCLCCGTPSFICQRKGPIIPSSAAKTKALHQSMSTHKFRSFTDEGGDGDMTSNRFLQSLLDNNKKWAADTKKKDPGFFDRIKSTQKPKYLYIGCSDSRVPANSILGLGPGEVFVHRNVGNMVMGNDLNCLSVLEYAVAHLGVTDIIVAGHYDCGAVRAATSRQDLGLLENWLRQIRDVYRIHKDYLDLISNDEDRHYSLVELNVIEQCLNIYKTGVVQRKRIQTRDAFLEEQRLDYTGATDGIQLRDEIAPRIHGMVFNPADGILKTLTVDFQKRVGSLDHIYGLYDHTRATWPDKQ